MTKKVEIPAMHDKEFLTILENLGLMSQIEKNIAVCFNCREPLNLKNVAGIKVFESKPNLVCDSPECLLNG